MPKVINAKKSGYTHYIELEGCLFPSKPTISIEAAAPGIYGLGQTQDGRLYFIPVTATSDDLVELPNFTSRKVINEVNKFWDPKVRARYARYGMVYKRGILLHGKQGTGKTSIITQIMEDHVNKGGIVFFCPSPGLLKAAANAIREIESKRDAKFLVIYEELDALLSSNEGGFLSLLDGEDQIENVVYVATTNYLDRIPPRIKNRPSRFSSIIEVAMPDEASRRAFLTAKIPAEDAIDLDLWVKASEGMTIDQLKDLIVSVLCIGLTLKDSVKKLLDMDMKQEDESEDIAEAMYGGNNAAAKMLLGMLGKKASR